MEKQYTPRKNKNSPIYMGKNERHHAWNTTQKGIRCESERDGEVEREERMEGGEGHCFHVLNQHIKNPNESQCMAHASLHA